ncbi:MAG TPA: OPT/YSL family transporter [Candidatus Cryosericum sp.]
MQSKHESAPSKLGYATSFREQLTVRSLILGALGSAVVSASSVYAALRMGALPWPTIFVAILSMAVLTALRHTNLNEINVTHTAMSAGPLVAGGLAFTIPGIWMINQNAQVSYLSLIMVTIAGTVLGCIFTYTIRRHFIEKEKLPYPMGVASSEVLLAGDEGGSKARVVFSTLGLAAVFVAIRDWFHKIPTLVSSTWLAGHNIFVGIWLSPMAVGIGYIIGPLYMGTWLLGGAFATFFLVPVGVALHWFADVAAATAFKNSLGFGLMLGCGIGVLVKNIIPKAREIFGPMLGIGREKGDLDLRWTPLVFALVAFALTVFTEMRLVPSIITIFSCYITTAMAATLTGQTGIDPMEVFGVLVLLLVKLFMVPGQIEAFLIAGVVACAAGLAGDMLQDFKSGYILHTDPKAQIIGEFVGGITGSFVAVAVLFVLHRAYGAMGPGTQLVAPQASFVAAMVSGLPSPSAFVIGLVAGFGLYVLNVPVMTIGIGVYLPFFISAAAAVGGLAKFIIMRKRPQWDEKVTLAASGFMGGEGVTGVIIAFIRVLTGTV